MIEIIPNWHPALVHFTVAMLIVATIIHLLSHFFHKGKLANQMTIVARWNFWIGVGFTLLTVAAGWYAYYTVRHDAPSHSAMIEHRNWAMVTLVLFLGIAGWEYSLSRRGKGKGWLFTGLLVIAAGLLLSTAWRGGELVYRYGLGVMSMPMVESHGGVGSGNGHEHGEVPMQDKPISNGHPHGAEPVHKTPDAKNAAPPPSKAVHGDAPRTAAHKD